MVTTEAVLEAIDKSLAAGDAWAKLSDGAWDDTAITILKWGRNAPRFVEWLRKKIDSQPTAPPAGAAAALAADSLDGDQEAADLMRQFIQHERQTAPSGAAAALGDGKILAKLEKMLPVILQLIALFGATKPA